MIDKREPDKNAVPDPNEIRGKVEAILPDYVLGRASSSDRQYLEQHIGQFPDLQEDLIQSAALFRRLADTDFDTAIAQRTRNLSVKVNERIGQKKGRPFLPSLFSRYLIPGTLVVACLTLVLRWDKVSQYWGRSPVAETVPFDRSLVRLDHTDLLAVLNSDFDDLAAYSPASSHATLALALGRAQNDALLDIVSDLVADNIDIASTSNQTIYSDQTLLIADEEIIETILPVGSDSADSKD